MVDPKSQSPSRVSTRASVPLLCRRRPAAGSGGGGGGGGGKPAAKKAKVTSSKPTSPPQGKKRAVEVNLSSDIAASADAVLSPHTAERRKLLPLLLLSPVFLVLPP